MKPNRLIAPPHGGDRCRAALVPHDPTHRSACSLAARWQRSV